ncbi:MAG: hypothetical protein E7294_00450 [Lachnospiraceae bacterium]|nr:hypothetical protein [Lachnospiraceae bacterium]
MEENQDSPEEKVTDPVLTDEEIQSGQDVESVDADGQSEEEETVSEAFSQSETIDGVKITVTADAGVFPDGAVLSVKKVSAKDAVEAMEAVNETEEIKGSTSYYTYDIKVLDQDGNELEPDMDAGLVNVSFETDAIADRNMDASVYHMEETAEGLEAEALDANASGEVLTAQTDGFSFYTLVIKSDNEPVHVLHGNPTEADPIEVTAEDILTRAEITASSITSMSAVTYTGNAITVSGTSLLWKESFTEQIDLAIDYVADADVTHQVFGLTCVKKQVITYDANVESGVTVRIERDNETITSESAVAGELIPLPAATRGDGYWLKGWSTNANGEGLLPEGNYTVPNNDQTLYAQWEAKTELLIRPDTTAKTFGQRDPELTYTILTDSAIQLSGKLKRAPGEMGGNYDYDLSDLNDKNQRYQIRLADSNAKFKINSRSMKAQSSSNELCTPDFALQLKSNDVYAQITTDGVYYFTYTGNNITPALELTYEIEDEEVRRALASQPGVTITGNAYVLRPGVDYSMTVTSEKNVSDTDYRISFRGNPDNGNTNFSGLIYVYWNIRKSRIPDSAFSAENVTSTYDGANHSIAVSKPEEAIVQYSLDQTGWTTENPVFKNVGEYTVYYKIAVEEDADSPYLGESSVKSATVRINRRDVEVRLDDAAKTYGAPDPAFTYSFTAGKAPLAGEEIVGLADSITREEGQIVTDSAYRIFISDENLAALNQNEGNANYHITVRNTAEFTIDPKLIEVNVANARWTYSDQATPFSYSAVGIVSGDSLNFTLQSAGQSADNWDRRTNAGRYTIAPDNVSPNGNYTVIWRNGTLTIDPKNIEASDTVKVLFDGSESSAYQYTRAEIRPVITLTDVMDGVEYVKEGDFAVSGQISATDFSTYRVKISGANNYKGDLTKTWSITPALNRTVVYDGQEHQVEIELPRRADSYTAVRYYEVQDEHTKTLKETNPAYRNAGTYKIYYEVVLGEDYYDLGTLNEQNEYVLTAESTLTILPKPVQLAAVSTGKVYDHNAASGPQLTYKVVSSGAVETVPASGAANEMAQIASMQANIVSDAVSALCGEDTLQGVSVRRAEGENAGEYRMDVAIDQNALNPNYRIDNVMIPAIYTIEKADYVKAADFDDNVERYPWTDRGTRGSVQILDKIKADENLAVEAEYVVNVSAVSDTAQLLTGTPIVTTGNSLSYDLTGSSGRAGAVAEIPVTISSRNYKDFETSLKIETLRTRGTISWKSETYEKVYDGNPVDLDSTEYYTTNNLDSEAEITVTYYSDKEGTQPISAPVNAGTYYARATVGTSSNYEQAATSTAKRITIRKRPVAVEVKKANSAITKVYDGVKTVTIPALYIAESADSEPAGDSGILAGATGVSGEALVISGITGIFDSPNVNFEGSTVTAQAVTVSTGSALVTGAASDTVPSNYEISYDIEGVRGVITQKEICVQPDDKEKFYGDPDPELTYSVWEGGSTSGTKLNVTIPGLSCQRDQTEQNALEEGNYYHTWIVGDNTNYIIYRINGNFVIKKRPITVDLGKVNAQLSKVYDGDPGIDLPDIQIPSRQPASVTSGAIVGGVTGVTGESFVIHDLRGNLETADVGTDKAVAIPTPDWAILESHTSITGGDAELSNYKFTFITNDVRGTVTPRNIEVTVRNANATIQKTYDGTNTASVGALYIAADTTDPDETIGTLAGQTGVGGQKFKITGITGVYPGVNVVRDQEGNVIPQPVSVNNYDATNRKISGVTIEPVGEMTSIGNYTFTYDVNGVEGKIEPMPIRVTAKNASKEYDKCPANPAANELEYEVTQDSVTGAAITPTPVLEGITISRAAGENVGTYPITVTTDPTKDLNYEIVTAGAVFTIKPKKITVDLNCVNGDPAMVREYDGTNSVSLPTIHIPAAESDVASDSGLVTGAYTGVSGEALVIGNITGHYENGDVAYDTTGGAVTTKAVTIDQTVASGSAYVITGASVSAAEGTATDPSNYAVFYQVNGVNGMIRPKRIDATITAQNKIYDGTTDANVNVKVLNNIGSESFEEINIPGTFASKDVQYTGTTVTAQAVTISAGAITTTVSGGAKLANYDIHYADTVNAKVLPKTATAVVIVSDKTYDGTTDAAVTAELTTAGGIVTGESFKVSGLQAHFADKDVSLASDGSVIAKDVTVITSGASITAVNTPQAVVSNYEFSYDSDTVTKQAIIRKKAATISPNPNQSKVYLATEPALTYNVTGLVSGEAIESGSVIVSRAAVLADPVRDEVGSYPIHITLATGSNLNYDIQIVTGEVFEIKKAENPWVTSPAEVEIACTDQDEKTYSFVDLITGAGIEGLRADTIVSYSAVQITSGEGVIAKKADNSFDAQITTDGVLKFKLDKKAVSNKTAQLSVTVTNKNYKDITLKYIVKTVQGTGTVAFKNSGEFVREYNGRPINWEYDGTKELQGQLDGKKIESLFETNNSEALATAGAVTFSYKGQTEQEIADNAETYSEDLSSSPKDVGKYLVTVTVNATDSFTAATTSAAFEIRPKELTIDVKARDKVYDGTTKVDWTASVDTGVEGEYISVKEIAAEFDSKDAGERTVTITPTVSGSAFNLLCNGRTDLNNYNVSMVSGAAVRAKIMPKKLTAENFAVVVSEKAYDGSVTVSPEAVTVTVDRDALVSGEAIAITGVGGTYENADAGERVKVMLDWSNAVKTLTESSEAVTVTDSSILKNYDLSACPQIAYGKVTKAVNTVSGLVITGWKYGKYNAESNTPQAEASYGSENMIFEYRAKTATDGAYSLNVPTQAGEYLVRARVDESANYAGATSAAVEFTISPSAITITASDRTKAYGADVDMPTSPEYGKDYTVQPASQEDYFSADDKLNVSLRTAAVKSSPAGTYAITPAYENTNYQATLVTGAYTVTRVDLAVDAQGYSGEYDGKAHSVAIRLSAADKSVSDARIYLSTGTALNSENFATAGEMVSPESITRKDAGSTTVYYYIDTPNYKADPLTGSAVINITPKKLTAVVTAKDKTYDATDRAELTATAATNIAGESLMISGLTGSFATANVGEQTVTINTGSAVIRGVGTTKASNYEVTIPAATTASIAKAANRVTVKLDSWIYDGQAKTVSTSATFMGEGEPKISYSENAAKDFVQEQPTEAGTYYVKAEVAETANYEAAQAVKEFTISPAAMTITADGYRGTYDGMAHGISVNVTVPGGLSSDAEVYYSTKELTKANIQAAITMGTAVKSATDTAVTLTTAGSKEVYYYVVSNDFTADSVSGKETITLAKKAISFTWPETTTFVYDGTAKTVTAAAAGFVEGDDVTVGAYESDAGNKLTNSATAAGTYTAKVKELAGNDKDNYSISATEATASREWTIAKAEANVTAEAYTGTYDGKFHGITVKAVSGEQDVTGKVTVYYSSKELSAENYQAAVTSSTDAKVTAKDTGKTAIYYYVTSDNYQVIPATGSAMITITPKPVGFDWSEDSFTYDGKQKEITAAVKAADIESGDAVKVGTYESADTTTNKATKAGIYTAKVATLDGESKANYAIATDSAVKEWTISQSANKVTIVSMEGWTYGDTPKTPDAKADFGTVTFTYSQEENGTYTAEVPVNAGTYYVKAAVAETTDYKAAVSSPTAFTIEPKEVGITWQNVKSFAYDGTEKTVTAEVAKADLVSGDAVTIETYQNNTKTEAGAYTAKATELGGEKAANYTFDQTKAVCDWEITKAAMTVTAAGTDKTYDGNAYGITVTTDTKNAPNDAQVYYSDKELTDANIDAAITLKTAVTSATDAAVTLKDAGKKEIFFYVRSNNFIPSQATGSAVITIAPKPVSFTWEGTEGLVYDGTAKTVTAKVADAVGTDIVNAGTYQDNVKTAAGTYTAKVLTLAGKDAANYTISATEATAAKAWTIAKAALKVTAAGVEETYDGNAYGISVRAEDADGKEVAEAVIYYSKISLNASNLDKAVTDAKDDKVTRKEAGSTTIYYYVKADNYQIDKQTGNAKIVIAKKPADLEWTADSFTYDGTKKQITATVAAADVVKGDEVSVDTYTKDLTNKITNEAVDAGVYTAKAEVLSGEDAANYSINEATASKSWNIAKASNNVKLAIAGWNYGESANAPMVTATFGQETAVITYSSDKQNYTENVPVMAGTWYARATIPATDNYGGAVSTPVEFKIKAAALKVTSKGYEGVYDGQAHGITVTADTKNDANADVEIYYSEEELTEGNIAEMIAGGKAAKTPVTRTDAGTTRVYYYVATNNYSAFPVCGSEQIVIAKKEVSFVWQAQKSFTYDGEEKSVTATVSGNDIVGEDEVVVEAYEDNSAVKAGVYTAKVKALAGTKADNYTFNEADAKAEWEIARAKMQIVAEGYQGTYDGKAHGITVTADTGEIQSDAKIYYSTKELTADNLESVIKLGQAVTDKADSLVTVKEAKTTPIYYYVVSENFEADQVSGSADVKIAKKEVGFTWNGTQGLVYDGKEKTVTADLTGVETGDEVSVGTYQSNTGKKAGSYTASVTSLTGKDAANYTFDPAKASVNFVIAKEGLAVTAEGYKGTYDKNAHGVKVMADVSGNKDADVKIWYSESELTAENIAQMIEAGTAKAESPTRTDAGTTKVYYYVTSEDYEAAPISGNVDIVIEKKKVGFNWQAVTEFAYDGNVKNVQATVTGTVGGDEITVGSYGNDAAGNVLNTTAAAGEYTAKVAAIAGAKADNYYFDETKAVKNWKITKAAITIKAADKSSRYGEDIAELTYEVGGAYVTGDELGITVATTATKNAKTGTYPITVSWNQNPNYQATITGATYTITKSEEAAAEVKEDEIKVTKASEQEKKDAAITGVNDTMEYSADGGTTWIPVPKGETSLKNLAAGTYLIRVAADENHDAGKPVSVTVEVKTYAEDGDKKVDTDELKDTYKDVKPAEGSVMDTQNLTMDEVIDKIAQPSSRKELIEKALANENGAAAVEVINENGAPVKAALNSSYVDLINELLTAEELIEVMAGAKAKLELVISPTDEKKLDSKVKDGVLALKKDDESVLYFEADLYKMITKAGETEASTKEHITELNGSLRITVDIPKQIRSKDAQYRLVRNHTDETTGELTTEVMEDVDDWDYTYTFVTNRLCTMAYIYSNDKEAAAAAKAAEEAKAKAEADAKAAAEKLENEFSLNAKLRVAAVGTRFVLRWGKVSGADGYEIYAGSAKGKYAKEPAATTKAGKKSTAIRRIGGKKIDVKKVYKFYVRAYKIVDGQKVTIVESMPIYSVSKQNTSYTNTKNTRIKKKSVTLKAGGTAKISAKTVLVSTRKKAIKAPVKEFRYGSTDPKIATVDETGTIRAMSAGTCYIWVYARNGNAQKVKVTVQ